VFDSITTTTIATNKSFNNICIHSENILLLSNSHRTTRDIIHARDERRVV
jgi:hypothetical protein